MGQPAGSLDLTPVAGRRGTCAARRTCRVAVDVGSGGKRHRRPAIPRPQAGALVRPTHGDDVPSRRKRQSTPPGGLYHEAVSNHREWIEQATLRMRGDDGAAWKSIRAFLTDRGGRSSRRGSGADLPR
jgi:hypothetical protein